MVPPPLILYDCGWDIMYYLLDVSETDQVDQQFH